MVRPEGLELSTFWFVAVEAGNLSALRGAAYGRFCSFSYSSIVRKLYANSTQRHSVSKSDWQPEELNVVGNSVGRTLCATRTKPLSTHGNKPVRITPSKIPTTRPPTKNRQSRLFMASPIQSLIVEPCCVMLCCLVELFFGAATDRHPFFE